MNLPINYFHYHLPTLLCYRAAITAAATTPAIAIADTLASTLTHAIHSDLYREGSIRGSPCPMIMYEDRGDLGDVNL
jgi:hypothetical protein